MIESKNCLAQQKGRFLACSTRSLEIIIGILGKVRLSDIIRVRKGLSKRAWAIANNRIDRKHVDFAICDLRTVDVIGVIELDDSSHNKDSRRKADQFVNRALAAAGVPIVRIPARHHYSPADIREQRSVLFTRNQ